MNFITYQQYMQQIKNNPLHAGLSDVKANYNIEPYDNAKVQRIDKKHDKIIKKVLSRKKRSRKIYKWIFKHKTKNNTRRNRTMQFRLYNQSILI